MAPWELRRVMVVMCCSRCSAPRACVISSATRAAPSCRSSTRSRDRRRRPPLRARAPGGHGGRRWPTATRRPPAGPRSSTSTPPRAWATRSATSPTRGRTARPLVVTAGPAGLAPHRHRPAALGRSRRARSARVEVGARGAHASTSSARSCDGRSTTPHRRRPGPVFVVACRCRCSTRKATERARSRRQIDRRAVPSSLEELADLLVDTPVGSLAIVAGDEVAASGACRRARRAGRGAGRARVRRGAALDAVSSLRRTRSTRACSRPRPRRSTPRSRPFRPGARGRRADVHGVPVHAGLGAVPRRSSCSTSRPTPARLGRTYPTRLGVVGDPKATLAALLPIVRGPRRRSGGRRRSGRSGREARHRDRRARGDRASLATARAPMDPMAAAHALVRALPPNTPVVDEAITTGFYVRGFHHWTEPGRYFFCKGGGLGLGHAGGARRLARHANASPCSASSATAPRCTRPQALWTAAHEQLPVVFAVVNNRQYLILKGYLRGMGRDSVQGRSHRRRWTSTSRRSTSSVSLARWASTPRSSRRPPTSATPCRAALESGRPHLLELPIAAP